MKWKVIGLLLVFLCSSLQHSALAQLKNAADELEYTVTIRARDLTCIKVDNGLSASEKLGAGTIWADAFFRRDEPEEYNQAVAYSNGDYVPRILGLNMIMGPQGELELRKGQSKTDWPLGTDVQMNHNPKLSLDDVIHTNISFNYYLQHWNCAECSFDKNNNSIRYWEYYILDLRNYENRISRLGDGQEFKLDQEFRLNGWPKDKSQLSFTWEVRVRAIRKKIVKNLPFKK